MEVVHAPETIVGPQVQEILNETAGYNEAANESIKKELETKAATQMAEHSRSGLRYPTQLRNAATKATGFLIDLLTKGREEPDKKPKIRLSEVVSELIAFSEGYIKKLSKKETRHSVSKHTSITLTPEQLGLPEKLRNQALLATILDSTLKHYLVQRGELQRDMVVENTAHFVISQFIDADPDIEEKIKNNFGDTRLISQIQKTVTERTSDIIKFAEAIGISLPESVYENGQLKSLTPQEAVFLIGSEKFSNALIKYMLASSLKTDSKDLFANETATELLDLADSILSEAELSSIDELHKAAHTLNANVLDTNNIFKRVDVDKEVEFLNERIEFPNIMIEIGDRLYQIPIPAEAGVVTSEFDQEVKEIVVKIVNTIFSKLEEGDDPFASGNVDFSKNILTRALASFNFLTKRDKGALMNLTRNTIGVISFRPLATHDEDLSTDRIPINTYFGISPSSTGFEVAVYQSFFHPKTDGEDAARGISRLTGTLKRSTSESLNYYLNYFKSGPSTRSYYTEIPHEEYKFYYPQVTEGNAEISIPTEGLLAIQKLCAAIKIFDPSQPDRKPPRPTITSAYIALANLLTSSNQEDLRKRVKLTVNYENSALGSAMIMFKKFAEGTGIELPDINFRSELKDPIKIVSETELDPETNLESEIPALIRQILSGSIEGMDENAIRQMILISTLAVTQGGQNDLIHHILAELPVGEQPYNGMVSSPQRDYPGTRLVGFVAPGHWGTDRSYRKEEFESMLKLIERYKAGKELTNDEIESLRQMRENLARVLLANEDVLVEERNRSLAAKNMAVLAQKTVTKLGVAGRVIEKVLKKGFPELFSSIAANASVQSIGGITDSGEYVVLDGAMTSQLYELQRITRHFQMCRKEGNQTIISNRRVPRNEKLDEIAFNEFVIRIFQSSIIEQYNAGQKDIEVAAKKAVEVVSSISKGTLLTGSRIYYRTMLNALSEGELKEMARYAKAIQTLNEITS